MSSEVRAGRAFVELSVKSAKFFAGLKTAMAKTREFAKSAQGAGLATFGIGAGATAGLVALVQGFTEAGNELGKFKRQTGFSVDALNGIVKAAGDSEVPLSELKRNVTFLQRLLATGGPKAAKAFATIGVAAEDLVGKSVEEVLAIVADRLPAIADESQRAAAAIAIFGKSGAAMLPVLDQGSEGLNQAAQAAIATGTAMSGPALEAAADLDDAFDALGNQSTGLRNELGAALSVGILPMIHGITGLVRTATEWARQNPELVQQALDLSIATAGLGISVAGLGAAIYFLTSPLLLTVTLLGVVAAGALATTDALGITETGFGSLFNSIEVKGRGLTSWMEVFWTYLSDGWNYTVHAVVSSVDWLSTKTKSYFKKIGKFVEFVTWPWRKVFGGLFTWLMDHLGEIGEFIKKVLLFPLKVMVGAMKLLGKVVGWEFDNTIGQLFQDDQLDADLEKRQKERDDALNAEIKASEDRRSALDATDPADGSGVSFNGGRFKSGLAEIGKGIRESISAGVEKVTAFAAPERTSGVTPFSAADLARNALAGAVAPSAQSQSKVVAIGTFDSRIASQLVGDGSSEARQTTALESINRKMGDLLQVAREGGGVFE